MLGNFFNIERDYLAAEKRTKRNEEIICNLFQIGHHLTIPNFVQNFSINFRESSDCGLNYFRQLRLLPLVITNGMRNYSRFPFANRFTWIAELRIVLVPSATRNYAVRNSILRINLFLLYHSTSPFLFYSLSSFDFVLNSITLVFREESFHESAPMSAGR